MRKMKLSLDSLAVDSFEVSPAEGGTGTIRGHQDHRAGEEVGIATDVPVTAASCPTACPTTCTCITVCNESCESCEQCSGATCYLTVCTCVFDCTARTCVPVA